MLYRRLFKCQVCGFIFSGKQEMEMKDMEMPLNTEFIIKDNDSVFMLHQCDQVTTAVKPSTVGISICIGYEPVIKTS